MYVIQEKIDGYWLDKTNSSDYEFILELYHNYIYKFPKGIFRVIEVFYYV